MSADVIPLPRREQTPCQEVVGRVATTKSGFTRLYENRVFHELNRQTTAVLRLAGTIPTSDVLASLLFHYGLAARRLEQVGIT